MKLVELQNELLVCIGNFIKAKQNEGVSNEAIECYAQELMAYHDDIECIMEMENISYDEYLDFAISKMRKIKI